MMLQTMKEIRGGEEANNGKIEEVSPVGVGVTRR